MARCWTSLASCFESVDHLGWQAIAEATPRKATGRSSLFVAISAALTQRSFVPLNPAGDGATGHRAASAF
jgi:hypothetical protein